MKKTIILILAALLLIGGGIFIILANKEPSEQKKEPQEEIPMGVSDDSEEPWDTYLYKDAAAVFDSIYNGKYDVELNENKEYTISLQDFSTKHNVTFPTLNTETVTCDLSQSKFVVFYDEDYKENTLSVDLKCTKVQ